MGENGVYDLTLPDDEEIRRAAQTEKSIRIELTYFEALSLVATMRQGILFYRGEPLDPRDPKKADAEAAIVDSSTSVCHATVLALQMELRRLTGGANA